MDEISRNFAKRPESPLVNVPYGDNFVPPTPCLPTKVTTYKNGAKIHWKLHRKPGGGGAERAKRGRITDMSPKARRRAAFAFGNAPYAWAWMATLTYQTNPAEPGKDWEAFLRKFRDRWDCACQYGWLMEYQTHGNVHYHLFLGADFVRNNGLDRSCRIEPAGGDRGETPVVRGVFDDWVVREWIAACETPTPAFVKFQHRGIIEPFRSPDAAARYVAKETGKKHQKALPEGVNGGRKWWWLSPEGQPVPEGTESLIGWPLSIMTSTVFDKHALDGCLAWKAPGEQMDIPF